jgi:hypothetical protein
MELRNQGKCDEHSNDEPAIVQADFDPADSAKPDLGP